MLPREFPNTILGGSQEEHIVLPEESKLKSLHVGSRFEIIPLSFLPVILAESEQEPTRTIVVLDGNSSHVGSSFEIAPFAFLLPRAKTCRHALRWPDRCSWSLRPCVERRRPHISRPPRWLGDEEGHSRLGALGVQDASPPGPPRQRRRRIRFQEACRSKGDVGSHVLDRPGPESARRPRDFAEASRCPPCGVLPTRRCDIGATRVFDGRCGINAVRVQVL